MDTADDLIMQEGGTSDLDRAKRIINKLQAENERLRAERKEAFEILSRLFDGSCFDCAFLEHCDKKGVAWDAYNIGTVARIDCLGAK